MTSSNETMTEELLPPTYLISDYIEIAYLTIVLCFGIPSNVIILRKLIREQKLSNRDFVKSGFVLLKINLNITDLFILAYALGKLIWLITYQWLAGNFICRFYQMFSMLSLYSSSNIVVCIALDRLRNVRYANQIHTNSGKINIVNLLAFGSWAFALLCSLPQFFLFQTIEVYPEFTQCSDIWQINRFSNAYIGFETDSFILSNVFENSYNIIHLVLVFWGPLFVLIIAYALIATNIMKYSLRTPTGQNILNKQMIEDSGRETIIQIEPETALLKTNDNAKNKVQSFPENSANSSNRNSKKPRTKRKNIRKHPIRESASVSTSTINTTTQPVTSTRIPTWRKQLRSRVFRTTMLVILTHFLFWFPYNALGLMKYVNQPLFELLSANANIFKDLQILITLINPFLYGFSSGH